MNTFDHESHTYQIAGRKVPSVTQIITSVFGERDYWSAYFAERGTALHRATELYDAGKKIKKDSIDPAIEKRFEGYQRYRDDTQYLLVYSEKRLYSKGFMFAGTMDRIFQNQDGEYILADIKSGFDPSVFVQLGGYSLLLKTDNSIDLKIKKAVVIVLSDQGKYNLKWIHEPDISYWEQAFLNVLSVYNLKKRHGM